MSTRQENIITKLLMTVALTAILWAGSITSLRAVEIRGAEDNSDVLMRWHRVSLTFDGPATSETADPNPYFNYRLEVTFKGPSGQDMTVPGFFAADGNAGRTGADSGNKWRACFSPDEVGSWTWKLSFRQGKDVAIAKDPKAGKSWKPLDGQSGTFHVIESDKTGRDVRSPGRSCPPFG